MENKSNGGLIAVIVLLVIALLGLVGYIAYDKGLIFVSEKEVEEKDENKKEEDHSQSNYISLEVKDENCINSRDMDYTLTSNRGVSVSLNDDNTVNLNITKNAYLSLTNNEVADNQTFTISNFSKRVIDVFDGTIGQDIYGETLIFLMEDGSIEYLPVRYALYRGTVQSYGKLDNVEGIVKLYSVFARGKGDVTGGGMSILAQKLDGTYYDLASILSATGNY